MVIPQTMRGKMLGKVHNSHLEVNGCLNQARECLYWPGMSNDIKNHEPTCEACYEYERSQPRETLCSHKVPNRPWQCVGIDLFELEGKHYLVTTDYFSKYINEHSSVIIQSNSTKFFTWILHDKTHQKNISNFVANVTLSFPGPCYEISITCTYPCGHFFRTMIFPLNFRHAYV